MTKRQTTSPTPQRRRATASPWPMPADGARPHPRVIIEGVCPEIDGGRFPIKRVLDDEVRVEARVFADGHDALSCRLLYRHDDDHAWQETEMTALGNDRWQAGFRVSAIGRYRYTIEGWIDRFGTWQRDFRAKFHAGQDIRVERLVGAAQIEDAAARAPRDLSDQLRLKARQLRDEADVAAALSEDLAALVRRFQDRASARYDRELGVVVDRVKAEFSAWYEVFPRSCSPEPGRHGTLRDCEAWLPYIAGMGFDVLYLPPIHPIARTARKGRNNAVTADPHDVGSPWAIGAQEGGHKSIHPELGSLEDLHRLIAAAHACGMEVALDLAYQCAPDHPYVQQHPDWFRKRPDGTIQYAENPPKRYQDIYPFDFECDQWRALWSELESVILYWVEQGVRVFRVDNPHTKTLAFWEWVIFTVKVRHPDVIFLAEAFTRPAPMYRLAKLGFSQSYTYFTWRNTRQELTDYFQEITGTEVREFWRPNLWPNTPDILHEYLQAGGPPAFAVRAVLATTLAASYGVYGPAFELCENVPREAGSEEYLHSEKYEIRHRDLEAPHSLRPLLMRLNRVRRENPALQRNRGLHFHATDNPLLICYSRATDDLSNVLIVVVNLDAYHRQSGWVTLDLETLGFGPNEAFDAHDLLGGDHFIWQGARNFVELMPGNRPAHVLRCERPMHSETTFEPQA